MPNDLLAGADDAVASVLHQDNRSTATAIRNNVQFSLDASPEKEAQIRRMAGVTGIPVESVRAQPEAAKVQATLATFDTDKLTTQFPHTAQFLTNLDNTRMVHDDVPATAAVEQAARASDPPTGMSEWHPSWGQRVSGWLRDAFGVPQLERARAANALAEDRAGLTPGQARDAMGGMSEIPTQAASNFFNVASFGIVPNVAGAPGTGAGEVGAGVGSLAGFMAGGPIKAVDALGSRVGWSGLEHVAGESFGKALAKDVVSQSVKLGTATALSEVGNAINSPDLTTALQHEGMAALSGAGMGAVFGAAGRLFPDQTLLQTLARIGGVNAAMDILNGSDPTDARSLEKKVFDYGLNTVFSLRGAGRTTGGWFHDAAKADVAVADASTIAGLSQSATASKLRERDPDAFKALVKASAEGGPLENLYIDAHTLADVLNQSGVTPEQVRATMPDVMRQMNEGLATKGMVQIPAEDYATHIAGGPADAALQPHLRTDPDAMTLTEAQAFQKDQVEVLKQQVEQIVSAKADDDVWQGSRQAVHDDVKQQLLATGTVRPDVADAYATLHRDFFETLGARMGLTPKDAYDHVGGARIVAEDISKGFNQPGGDAPAEGPFGPSHEGFHHDAAGAVAKLKEAKGGEVVGALHHPEVGDIDLVWGKAGTKASDGYGLAKLVKFHPEVVDHLQDVIDSMEVVSRSENRVNLESADHRAAVRLNWDGRAKKWLLTAFQKQEGGGESRATTDTAGLGGKDDTARPTSAPEDIVDAHLKKFYQGAGNRGAYDPESRTVALLKGADLSTFLHETGHFFLDTYARVATLPDAPTGIKADFQTLLDGYGVKDAAAWHGMTLEQQREHHENFARGFEAYLMEGKAPSVELQSLFQRFRAWLLTVYKSLAALKVELTPEVRGVMDRMLASDEAIRTAEQVRGYEPLFKAAEDAGFTPEQWTDYQREGVEATQSAVADLETRSLRDMKWLAGAKSRALRELQRDAASKRREIRNEVTAEVEAQQVYRAEDFLKSGKLEIGHETNAQRKARESTLGVSTKLDLPTLKEMYGDGPAAPWRYLSTGEHGLATARGGLHPDLAAEVLGYSSGDHLVRELLAAEPRKPLIEGLTDQRMLERHGELSDPVALERAAEMAIHNEVRARFLATELKALAKAVGPARLIAQAAKAAADAAIAAKRVRDLRPTQYTTAEGRAARNAEKALQAGDLVAAANEKRAQLLNNRLAKGAADAIEEISKGVDYLRKFEKDSTRRSVDVEYVDQIDALLERFDLRKSTSGKEIDRKASLAEWLEKQKEMGLEPDIPADLLDAAYRTSYKMLTVEQFRGLVDTVKGIEHLGRLKNRLLTAKEQRDYEVVRDTITSSIRDHAGDRVANTRTATDTLGRVGQGLRRFFAAHLKAASLARIMDGGKDAGPMWEYLVRPANERGDWESTERAKATEKLSKIMAPVFAQGRMGGKGIFFPALGRSLNGEARFSILLNIGNEGNLQRLLGGEGWTAQQLRPVLEAITPVELKAAQAVWDHFESYRPQIGAKEKRVYGKEPAWVEPGSTVLAELAAGHGVEMTGGYYPIKYDPLASQRAGEHADAEAAKRQLQGAYTSATTRRSFTKSRVDEVSGRPLLYSLSGLYSGVQDVIHDLAWHEWLIDANRLMKSRSIDSAIREHYGPEIKDQFKEWVKSVAEGERGASGAGEEALSRLRQGVSAAGLGFNVVSAMMQPLGITQSIVRVGPTWVGKGIAQYLAHPIDATREANGKSEFMANRARTRFRELNELRNQVQGQTKAGEAVQSGMYFLMMKFQQAVDVPTWHGAYQKAVAEGHAEGKAIDLADQAVIDSQGGGQLKDLSAIERGGPAMKLFTVFYSFMNTALNLGVSSAMSPASAGRKAADMIMLAVIPPMLGLALKQAITPGGNPDEWDWDKLGKKMLAAEVDYLMGLMVVAREFSEAVKTLTGANDLGRDYTGPAGLRMVVDVAKLAGQAHQGEFDDAFRKAAVNVAGDALGLPAAQVNRTVDGAEALARGETQNPAALALGFRKPH